MRDRFDARPDRHNRYVVYDTKLCTNVEYLQPYHNEGMAEDVARALNKLDEEHNKRIQSLASSMLVTPDEVRRNCWGRGSTLFDVV